MTTNDAALRFGVLDLPNAPFPALLDRWRLLEDLGFDVLWMPDHTAYWQDPSALWFDGWVALAAAAMHTARMRIGTLVSNPILRHPVMLARQAAAVDALSGGRLELGIGTGIAGFDHAALGSEYWPAKERAERFAEYVAVVDDVLRSGATPYSSTGRYYSTGDARIVPEPVQRPRPPLTLGGQSPTVLRLAAARADCWNTHGPPGANVDEILAATQRQTAVVDELCSAAGRDPASLRRALLLFGALDPWTTTTSFERTVAEFSKLGVSEFVVMWPGDERRSDLERLSQAIIPPLRAS